MKKKVLLIVMIGVLAMESAMTAFAGEAETTAAAAEENTIVWDETMEKIVQDEGFGGKIYSIDALSMQIYIPDGMEQREPTEEEKAKDTVLVFDTKDSEDKIEIVVGQMGDMKTLDDVKAYLEKQYPDMKVIPTRINNYETLMFGNEEADSMTVLISAGDAGFLRVICHPVKDETKNKMFSLVAASLQSMPEE